MSNVYRTAEENGASAEELIILCCIRLHAGTHEVDQLNKLLQSNVEWDKLIQLARAWYFYLSPLLYMQLSTVCPTLVPPAVMERLRTDFQSNAKHNAMLIRELLTILERFNREGIHIIPYKDPLSARKVYGNVGLRVFTDLDLFIHESDVARATEVLRTQGYILMPQCIDTIGDALDVATARDRIFAKDPAEFLRRAANDRVRRPFDFANDRGGKLELTWYLLPRMWSVTRNNDQLWARARKEAVDGTHVCLFSPEDSLLLACIHGVKHGWGWWNLFNDVAALITAHTDLNWDQLVTIARQRGCLRILTIGLLLANEVAGAPLPEDIRQRLDHDPRTRAYVQRVVLRLFQETTSKSDLAATNYSLPGLRYAMFMQERVSDKFRTLLRATMQPGPTDVKMLPSLASHTKVWYLLHPVLLAVRQLQYLLKSRP
jgi:hypothetical protein